MERSSKGEGTRAGTNVSTKVSLDCSLNVPSCEGLKQGKQVYLHRKLQRRPKGQLNQDKHRSLRHGSSVSNAPKGKWTKWARDAEDDGCPTYRILNTTCFIRGKIFIDRIVVDSELKGGHS